MILSDSIHDEISYLAANCGMSKEEIEEYFEQFKTIDSYEKDELLIQMRDYFQKRYNRFKNLNTILDESA
jgi:3-deoxy-D-arabino-heptulosonate 7-phosphate (DAHP) synthase